MREFLSRRSIRIALLLVILLTSMQVFSGKQPVKAASPALQSWQVVSSPNGTGNNTLKAITFPSSTEGWAGGFHGIPDGSPALPLLEHYVNGTWQLYTKNLPANGVITGMASTNPSDVWAVGQTTVNGMQQAFIMHWNGSSWNASTGASLPANSYGATLNSVAAISPSDVWVVGTFAEFSVTGEFALTEHYDGSTWTQVNTPPSAQGNFDTLFSVSAVAHNDVWAVGTFGSGTSNTFTQHWDGSSWTIFPSSDPTPNSDYLMGVTAISTKNVWAIGGVGSFFENWNGSSWSNPVYADNEARSLDGIASASASDIWAVGFNTPNDATFATVQQHYDGTSWTTAPSDNIVNGTLSAVTSAPDGTFWAVGQIYNSAQSSATTLIEKYAPQTPTPGITATVSVSSCINTLNFRLQNATADQIRVSRNGQLIAKLSGTATRYKDSHLNNWPSGFAFYEIAAFYQTHFITLTRAYVPATGCSGTTPPPGPSQPLPDSKNDLFVLVQGINTSLQNADYPNDSQTGNSGYGYVSSFEDYGTVGGNLIWNGYRDSHFIVFSYNSFYYDGMPQAYQCQNTWDTYIQTEAQRLAAQINAAVVNNPNIRVHILAHSLGGVVAFAYVAGMVEHLAGIQPLPKLSQIKDVNFLDSPLGGVIPNATFLDDIMSLMSWSCSHATKFYSFGQLVTLFANAKDVNHLGQTASIVNYILGGNKQNPNLNQTIAEDIYSKTGTVIDVIGNLNDNLWQLDTEPLPCESDITNFPSTEHIKDDGSGVFSRIFTSGLPQCILSEPNSLNHIDVLHTSNVNAWILQIVEGVQTPTGLDPYTG